MKRVQIGLKPSKLSGTKFNTSKEESLYSKFPKSVNFSNDFDSQTEQAKKELREFSIENDYPTAFYTFTKFKRYYNKFKAVQW